MLLGGVEDGAVGEFAGIVHLHDGFGLGLVAGAGCEDFVSETGRLDDDVLVGVGGGLDEGGAGGLLGLGFRGLAGGFLLLRGGGAALKEIHVFAFERLHLLGEVLALAFGGDLRAGEHVGEFILRELHLRETGALRDDPAEGLKEELFLFGREFGGLFGGCGGRVAGLTSAAGAVSAATANGETAARAARTGRSLRIVGRRAPQAGVLVCVVKPGKEDRKRHV